MGAATSATPTSATDSADRPAIPTVGWGVAGAAATPGPELDPTEGVTPRAIAAPFRPTDAGRGRGTRLSPGAAMVVTSAECPGSAESRTGKTGPAFAEGVSAVGARPVPSNRIAAAKRPRLQLPPRQHEACIGTQKHRACDGNMAQPIHCRDPGRCAASQAWVAQDFDQPGTDGQLGAAAILAPHPPVRVEQPKTARRGAALSGLKATWEWGS